MADFKLLPGDLVPHWAGTGVQFNAHTYAPISEVPAARIPELEQKVHELAPQFVRVFYNHEKHGDLTHPETQNAEQKSKSASFIKTLQLAQKAGATINVTWQSLAMHPPGMTGKSDAEKTEAQDQLRRTTMNHFADLLEQLVQGTYQADDAIPITNLRWVTLQNEPNTASIRQVTKDKLGAAYRRLHDLLVAKGLKQHIHLMGGDLIEGNKDPNHPNSHHAWFQHIETYADVLDACSVHIYWKHTIPKRFHFRLDDVNSAVDTHPHLKRLPLLVTEFGVRGDDFGKKGIPKPGNYIDPATGAKTPIGETNIAAFQQAWFLITAAQKGYAGVLKWDCYYGMHDNAAQTAYAIGKPDGNGWPLYPTYFLLQLIAMSTEPGWSVRKLDPPTTSQDQCVAAFGSQDGGLALIGLNEKGQDANGATSGTSTFTFSGLPKNTTLSFALWNKSGQGHIAFAPDKRTDAQGGLSVENVPLHSVFVLTTKPLPAH